MKAFVSTHPFSQFSERPSTYAQENGIQVRMNPLNRKLTSEELATYIEDSEILIAGTEKITSEVLERSKNLKFIARVGIGLDGVDFEKCQERGIRVSNTPDAPTIAVAELCVALMIEQSRRIHFTSSNLKNGIWHRHMGSLIRGKTVGIIGFGRIGKTLASLLGGFGARIVYYDIEKDIAAANFLHTEYVPFKELLRISDIVSVNCPLSKETEGMISGQELSLMKKNSILINTARGGIVDEGALYSFLREKRIAGAAVDVFEEEPYSGELRNLDNCVLTCHMGASTIESRNEMEITAVEEVVRFKSSKPLKYEVDLHG